MSNIRIVALDLDGTLLNHKNASLPCHPAGHCRGSGTGGGSAARHRAGAGQPARRWWPSCPACGMPSPPTVPPCGTWAADPLGAVYSRYADAAERQTSRARLRLLRRLMPVETAREVFALYAQYSGGLSVFADG